MERGCGPGGGGKGGGEGGCRFYFLRGRRLEGDLLFWGGECVDRRAGMWESCSMRLFQI